MRPMPRAWPNTQQSVNAMPSETAAKWCPPALETRTRRALPRMSPHMLAPPNPDPFPHFKAEGTPRVRGQKAGSQGLCSVTVRPPSTGERTQPHLPSRSGNLVSFSGMSWHRIKAGGQAVSLRQSQLRSSEEKAQGKGRGLWDCPALPGTGRG